MKWAWGIPKANIETRNKLLEQKWTLLKQSMMSPVSVVSSVTLIFITTLITVGFALLLDPSWKDWVGRIKLENSDQMAFMAVSLIVVSMVAVLYVHEFVHAIFLPRPFTDRVIVGSNGAFGFTYTEQQISRERYMVVAIMPFLLSFLGLLALSWFGYINIYTVFLCVINAGGAAADIYMIIFLLIKVPRGARVIFLNTNGGELFYK